MGRRILRMVPGYLPVLMGEGIHHYSVHKNALPENCRIVDATMCFRESEASTELALLLESPDWEPTEGSPVPEIKPSLVRHHCP